MSQLLEIEPAGSTNGDGGGDRDTVALSERLALIGRFLAIDQVIMMWDVRGCSARYRICCLF